MEMYSEDFNRNSLSSETESSSMDVSFVSTTSNFINYCDFDVDLQSSKSCTNSSYGDSECPRSNECDINNSICFNNSVILMLQCEEKEHKENFIKLFEKAKKCSIEPIHDISTIEEIDAKSVKTIVKNNYSVDGFNYCVIDVRFPFEYNGGHIRGAINLFTPIDVFQYFFGPDELSGNSIKDNLELIFNNIITQEKFSSNLKLIFHCEFSSVRGPKMAEEFRCIDRFANLSCYPNLFYPKIYILKGGYRTFYMRYKELCEPCGYRRMELDENVDAFAYESEENKVGMHIPVENSEDQSHQIEHFRNIVENQLAILTDIKQAIILQRKQQQLQRT